MSFSKLPETEPFANFWTVEEQKAFTEARQKFLKQQEAESNSQNFTRQSNVKCKKCDSFQVQKTFLQTRSADEGMTCFFTCVSCGNKWNVKG